MNLSPNMNSFYDAPTDAIWFYDAQGRLKGIDQCPNCQTGEQIDGNILNAVDRQRVEAGLQQSINQRQS